MMFKKILMSSAAIALSATGAEAADVLNPGRSVPLALTSLNYSENFNSMKSTSLDLTPADTLPLGWQAYESGSRANGTYQFGTSGSNTPGIWSYGLTNERALGAHADSEVSLMYFGAIFENGLGGVIDSLNTGYTGEQWQNGFNRATLRFQYSLDATSINNGSWTSFSDLDFLAPNTATQSIRFGITQTNGNNAAFRSVKNGLIDNLAIGAGDTFGIRWTLADIDPTGFSSDDGLGVDDFTLTATLAPAAVPEPATWGMMIAGFGLIGGTMRRRQRSAVGFA